MPAAKGTGHTASPDPDPVFKPRSEMPHWTLQSCNDAFTPPCTSTCMISGVMLCSHVIPWPRPSPHYIFPTPLLILKQKAVTLNTGILKEKSQRRSIFHPTTKHSTAQQTWQTKSTTPPPLVQLRRTFPPCPTPWTTFMAMWRISRTKRVGTR